MKKLLLFFSILCLILAGCAAPKAQQEAAQTAEQQVQEQQPEAETEEQAPAEAEQPAEYLYQLGEKMEDFTVTTTDGESFTLSEVLKEKDMVFINFWATWCINCCEEFPAVQQAYLQYQDQVEVIALSIEPTDTDAVMKQFAERENLSFKFAQDTPDFYNKFQLNGIPSSVVVDRFGNICFMGYIVPETEEFLRLFDAFVGDDYESSVALTAVPPQKPHMEPSSEEALSAALGAAAFNHTDKYTWPMLVTEKDGRSVVASSNAGVRNTTAAVTVKTEAKAGDAIAVTFKTSSEAAADLLRIHADGKQIKSFGGEHDWTTYAWPVERDGEIEVTFSYPKDPIWDEGEDTVWIDSVSVLSGQEADAALAANPVYPVADEITIVPVECEAREVLFEDAAGIMEYYFTSPSFYLVDQDAVTIHATLNEDVDPEGAFFSHMFEGSYFGLTTCMTEDGYALTREVASIPESVIPFTAVIMGLDPAGTEMRTIVLFRSEENIAEMLRVFELDFGWYYADEQTEQGSGKDLAAGEVTYTVRCVDQNGAPVEGVMVQICDDVSCRAVRTDAEGLHVFTSAPTVWEIHVLAAPEGYTANSDEVLSTALTGGEITLTLEKN